MRAACYLELREQFLSEQGYGCFVLVLFCLLQARGGGGGVGPLEAIAWESVLEIASTAGLCPMAFTLLLC